MKRRRQSDRVGVPARLIAPWLLIAALGGCILPGASDLRLSSLSVVAPDQHKELLVRRHPDGTPYFPRDPELKVDFTSTVSFPALAERHELIDVSSRSEFCERRFNPPSLVGRPFDGFGSPQVFWEGEDVSWARDFKHHWPNISKNVSDGLYHYYIFISAIGRSPEPAQAYNLLHDTHDICSRISAGGMFLRYDSNTVRIPQRLIEAVLGQTSGQAVDPASLDESTNY